MTRNLRRFFVCSGIALCTIHTTVPARAQETDRGTADIPQLVVNVDAIPDAIPGSSSVQLKDDDPRRDGEARVRVVDGKFSLLAAALAGAMTADTYSTFRSDAWCPSCKEQDPYSAPFINRGPAAAYAAGAAFDVGVMGLAAVMRKSENPALRAIWWAPPVALIIGHGLAVQHNLGLRNTCDHNPHCGR